MIHDRDAGRLLKDTVLKLLSDRERLNKMSEASRRLGKPEAGREMAQTVLGMIQ